MKKPDRYLKIAVVVFSLVFGLASQAATPPRAFAAPTTVNLLSTAPFAILAGTGVSRFAPESTLDSTITGNVGLSPATGAAMTLTCAEVTGTIYDIDGTYAGTCEVTNPALLTTAKNDLVTAYDDAAGRTPVTIVPSVLSGTTLTAGVYASNKSNSFTISAGAGPLVLDGQGDPSSVFIFEMPSSGALSVGPGSTVSLINGAQACNVFWRANSASFSDSASQPTVFKGTILALTSITVRNGVNIEGRLLARDGNVIISGDIITVPTCIAETTATAEDTDTTPADTTDPTTPATETPTLPKSGGGPASSWAIIITAGILLTLVSFYLGRKTRGVNPKLNIVD